MSLKNRYAASGAAGVIEIDAPELGEGGKAYLRRFTIGDRLRFIPLFDEMRKLGPDKQFLTPVDEQLRHLLPLVACEPDGSFSFAGPNDPGVIEVPTHLAERMINEVITRSTVGADEAKKPSGAETPSSSI